MAKKNDISLALDELKKCGETLIALSEAMARMVTSGSVGKLRN